MLVEEKYFFQDKNYLLKTVQAFSKDGLTRLWLQEIINAYFFQHNPMGLEDDFIIELKSKISVAEPILLNFYDILAAIYRYDFGDNQLAFQWDGRSHLEVYDAEWKIVYKKWIYELSQVKEIQRPIIRLAVSGSLVNTDFLYQSIRRGLLGHFAIRMRSQTIFRVSA